MAFYSIDSNNPSPADSSDDHSERLYVLALQCTELRDTVERLRNEAAQRAFQLAHTQEVLTLTEVKLHECQNKLNEASSTSERLVANNLKLSSQIVREVKEKDRIVQERIQVNAKLVELNTKLNEALMARVNAEADFQRRLASIVQKSQTAEMENERLRLMLAESILARDGFDQDRNRMGKENETLRRQLAEIVHAMQLTQVENGRLKMELKHLMTTNAGQGRLRPPEQPPMHFPPPTPPPLIPQSAPVQTNGECKEHKFRVLDPYLSSSFV